MPGKINPVMPEALNQAAFLVIGNDLTVSMAAEAGQLERNAFLPVMLFQLFESIDVLSNSIRAFVDNCVKDVSFNEERCRYEYEHNLAIATVLNPLIGYEKSTELVKKAREQGKTIFEIAEEEYGLSRQEIEKHLFMTDSSEK